MTASLEAVVSRIAVWRQAADRPLILGICGAQGSGKSTLAEGLRDWLTGEWLTVALLSLDDLYLPREARPVHVSPLFATRGVPGTHDLALGERTFNRLKTGLATRLPRFDKASDAPVPEAEWPEVTAPDVVIFEGWCVGARPQIDEALRDPINCLEREDGGAWRQAVNAALKGPYAALFAHIDRLVFLAAPDFSVVRDWRIEQEKTLRQRLVAESRSGAHIMSDDEIGRFIQYYQRLTEHILVTMPAYADLTLPLDRARHLINSART